MAPISEKRPISASSPTHISKEADHSHAYGHGHAHAHNNQNSYHTKENASATKHTKQRGLEILDFRESWLEEVEIYKDKLYVQKQHKQQHLLNAHNHVHSPQGFQLELSVNNNNNANNSSGNPASAVPKKQHHHQQQHNSSSSEIKTKVPELLQLPHQQQQHSNSFANKQRVVVRNSPATSASGSEDKKNSIQRPREESAKSSGSHSKRHAHHSHPHLHSHSHSSHSHPNTSKSHGHSSSRSGSASISTFNGGITSLSSNAITSPNTITTIASNTSNVTSASGSKPAVKVIVNQFHASSLLNAHHNEEKTKILTQNGLTKSAATAYETSLYASNYLPQDNRSLQTRFPDNVNYVGVSLAKSGGDGKDSRTKIEDDPCAAIDDVNNYTDSDSEDEYTGFPFYLQEDTNETHQSRNIRYQPEQTANSSDSDSDDRSDYYKPSKILSPSIFPNVPPYLNFSSHVEKGPPMPGALHRVLKWRLSPVMPKIVKRVVLNSGFRIIKNTTDWMAVWEKHMKSPGFRTIRSHQKYNHMPGSFRIGRKDTMWRSIHNNMKKFGKRDFGFMQKSYIMPDDLESLRQVWPKNASKLTKWIVKPPASARGTGIRIVNRWSQFPKDRPLVVQKYIERPLLINDNKFDMRIYVVLTSINPLRIYMYKDGLARFASVKYSPELTTLDDRCMHLTNYSINKFSQNYSKNEDFNACQGHKWTLQSLWSCLEARGVNTKRLWATLRNLIIKAIVSGESGLNRMYRQNVNFRYNCFELFGFDVLLDENLVPWLLEINISPSLHSELPLDLHVKGPLIQAVLNTALYQVPPKLNEKQQKEILEELHLNGPLCHDKRIFTTCLTAEEVRKHNQFTNRSIEFREEYLDAILENLLPDDVRCLIIAEDEYARCAPLERIFPTPDTHIYLKFIENPRYYNRLLDAWENRYGHFRSKGIAVLTEYCAEGYHLQVSDAALDKEPNVALTEIDMLHQKKSTDTLTPDIAKVPGDRANVSKSGSPEANTGALEAITSIAGSHDVSEKNIKTSKDHKTNSKPHTGRVNTKS